MKGAIGLAQAASLGEGFQIYQKLSLSADVRMIDFSGFSPQPFLLFQTNLAELQVREWLTTIQTELDLTWIENAHPQLLHFFALSSFLNCLEI